MPESFCGRIERETGEHLYQIRRLNVPCGSCETEPIDAIVTARYSYGDGKIDSGRVVLVQQDSQGRYFF